MRFAIYLATALLALTSCTANPAGGEMEETMGADAGPPAEDPFQDLLDSRRVDYHAALRSAALKLVGALPTLEEQQRLSASYAPEETYRELIDGYLSDPRFASQARAFFRRTFKMGGTPLLDSAPTFAAQIAYENRSYLELMTAENGTCPTLDEEEGEFTSADCDNGLYFQAGLLSHPGVQSHFYGHLAFRRVRWVQETFACTAYPAEFRAEAQPVGDSGGLYTAPWPFESIAGTANGGDVDFLDTKAVICANCHATMNHLAPLFAYFDSEGRWQSEIAVTKPIDDIPMAARSDWLPDSEQPAWRYQVPVENLAELGQAMAADPLIAECAVARAWNWAMGKGDIVDTLAIVPPRVIEAQIQTFVDNDHRMRDLLLDVFTSDDFVRF